jgi:LuxR family maltose regulon positive regulatory protein
MSTSLSIAKITRPRLAEVLPRKRLFGLLDKSRKQYPITWISGPPGSGKTTITASYLDSRKLPCLWYQLDEGDADIATFFYFMGLAARQAAPRFKKPLPLLTPEYLMGVPAFTRRYFEGVYGRLTPPAVVVFDNYQDVPESSSFHEMIRYGLATVPPGIAIIVLSRGDVPAAFADLRAKNNIERIGWNEIRFTESESSGFLRLRDKRLSKEAIAVLCERMQGWAAGLVLMTERDSSGPGAPHPHGDGTREHVFDYFAGEILNRLDSESRDFLLISSFLPNMTVQAAEQLTGNVNAGRILQRLSRSNFFTEKHAGADPFYRYHPLFREFLQARARENYRRNILNDLRVRAGQILEQSGQIEDAAELYRLTDDRQNLIRLVLSQAQSMVSQGRNRSLEAWLRTIPAEDISCQPWLLYWLGECRMLFDLAEARRYFEQALELFKTQHEATGIFLAWAAAVEAMVWEMGDNSRLDAWVVLFKQLVKEFPFPSPRIEALATVRIFTAMRWRRTDPDFMARIQKALALLESEEDPGLRVLAGYYLYTFYGLYIGDRTTSTRVLDAMRTITVNDKDLPPSVQILEKTCEAAFAWQSGAHDDCSRIVAGSLALADATGCHIFDSPLFMHGAIACLHSGDLGHAEQLIEKMTSAGDASRPYERLYRHLFKAQLLMLKNEHQRAIVHGEKALEIAAKTSWEIAEAYCRFALSHLMQQSGDQKRAKEHIGKCRLLNARIGSTIIEFMSLLTEASFSFHDRDKSAALHFLKSAMARGREQDFIYFFWWHPSLMLPLCMKALEAGIEAEYVKGLVRKYNIPPEEPPYHIEHWPWPLKVYTFGEFRVLRDDKPLRYSKRAPKKTLDLLRVIIALGGRNLSEERLIDALWPDAEGDGGRNSLSVTLARLRELIGVKDAVQVSEGMFSLNNRLVWTDVWAFERLIRTAAAEKEKRDDLEKAVELYHGDFLAEESGAWAISPRERLRESFLHAIESLGRHWERKQEWHKAVEVYRKGINADDLSEKCYLRTMSCLLKLGSQAEALSVYRRLKKILNGYGVRPSAEAEALYHDLTENKP